MQQLQAFELFFCKKAMVYSFLKLSVFFTLSGL